ncbi:MAG: AAA family ATPase [Friedmanniella sp.]
MTRADAFVGRVDELRALGEEWGRARAGEPRLVWLTGTAGIGKTSLLRRFVGGLPAAQLLWAGADESEAEVPYGVLTQLVAELPSTLPCEFRLDADPLAVGSLLLDALGALQTLGPVLVVIDDAHWADRMSVQALVFVLRRLRSDQVLVVLSARSDPPMAFPQPWERALAQSQLTRRLPLGGLTPADLRRLSPTADGVLLPPAAGRLLHEHTGGHPLYARALLEELPAEALMEPTAVLPAPRSLASLVLVRLAKLSDAAQSLVLSVAVLGPHCALSDAVRVAEVADPVAALDEAVRAGLLVTGSSGRAQDVAFPHLLLRGAVYADLAPARRHALHARAAVVLGGAPALAHRVAAAVGPDAELAEELESLGHGELCQQRWGAAADHLLAAADLSPTAADKGHRTVQAVAAMVAGGDLARAARWEPVVRAAPAGSARSRVLGQIALLAGRLSVARAELSAAPHQPLDGGTAPVDHAVLTAYLGLLSLLEGHLEQAVDLADTALADVPAAEATVVARFTQVLGLASLGRQLEAAELLPPVPEGPLEDPVDGLHSLALHGFLALWSGRDQDAAAALGEVLRRLPPGGLTQGRIMLVAGLAEALYRLGDWDGAANQAELALSFAEDAGILLGDAILHAVAGYVAAGQGLWEAAESAVQAAVRSAAGLPWWGARAYAATAQATLAQARGDYRAMRESLRAFDDPALRARLDNLGALPWRVLLVESLLGLGLLDAAADALTELQDRTSAGPPGWSALEAARLEAWLAELTGDVPAARLRYGHALQLAGQVQAALSRGRLETAYGRFLLGQGERRAALDLLRTAHERLERLGAKPFVAVCAELLHDAGLRPPTADDPLGFTVQERAVARLVASGRTNAETGVELFITSRTVAFHLTNIYAKAGISSRRDLAQRFPDLLA